MTDATMLNSPIELELRGTKYNLYTLNVGDLSDFENKIKSDKVAAYLRAANSSGAPSSERSVIVRDILNEKIEIPEVIHEMFTISGLVYTLWLSIRKGNIEFTLDESGALIGQDNWEDVALVLETLIVGKQKKKDPVKASRSNSQKTKNTRS